MRHFWSRKMVSVNGGKPARGRDAGRLNCVAEVARVLQNKPAALKGILSRLHKRGLLASSPARQVAQTAIASRCGDSVDEGIAFVEVLSLPVTPVKLYGPTAFFGGRRLLGVPNPTVLQEGYDGFKTPLSLLKALPEEHSFVDLFEQLLLSSRETGGDEPAEESQCVRSSTAVIAGNTAQFLVEHDGYTETVRYEGLEEVAGSHKDVAQFTGRTISLLAGFAEEPLARDKRPWK
jgi:hypothetical protein